MKCKYRIVELYLKESCFQKDRFFDAVATYVHECCHTFGGDSSEAFSYSLTTAMEKLMTASEIVEVFHDLWKRLFQ